MATKVQLDKLDKKITALSDALAKLGRGTTLQDLLKIIRKPGWTTPAELAFANTIVDALAVQVGALDKLTANLARSAALVRPGAIEG